jgi:hypothetical protein
MRTSYLVLFTKYNGDQTKEYGCEISGSHGGSMKMTAFWDTAPCSQKYTPLKRRSTSTRLHGAISQKAVNFKENEMGKHVAGVEDIRNSYKISRKN